MVPLIREREAITEAVYHVLTNLNESVRNGAIPSHRWQARALCGKWLRIAHLNLVVVTALPGSEVCPECRGKYEGGERVAASDAVYILLTTVFNRSKEEWGPTEPIPFSTYDKMIHNACQLVLKFGLLSPIERNEIYRLLEENKNPDAAFDYWRQVKAEGQPRLDIQFHFSEIPFQVL